ncbi:MAG: NAD-dependent epimerase/dehydratase family protein [Vicinamibacterales bacterium]
MTPDPSDARPVPSAPCLVTGATGAIGPALVRALVEEGHPVRVLARRAPGPGLFPAGVEVVAGDVTDPASVDAAAAGTSRVFHLAAKLHLPNPSPDLHPDYERVNVEGTRHVMDAARRHGVARVVFFSTISVYGPSRGQVLTEDSPARPETIYAATKHRAEQIVLGAAADAPGTKGTTAAAGTAGTTCTILRLAAVYGPRVKGNYRRLLDAMARGRFVPIGRGRNRRTLVFEEDVARAAVLAAAHPAAAGRAFNVTDGTHPPLADIVAAIARALGQHPPRFAVPVAPVRLAAGAADRAARLLGRRLTIGAAVDKYLEDVAVDGRRIQADLGFVPAFDLDAGWRRTVARLRQDGVL